MIGLAIFLIGMVFGGAGACCFAAIAIERADEQIRGGDE